MENSHLTISFFLELFFSFIIAMAASSGFWLWVMKKSEKKDLSRRLLIGLAHDRVVYLAVKYIKKGWITRDEFENLYEFLWEPYKEIGGNGTAKRLIDEVNKLPIRDIENINRSNENASK